MTQTLDITFSSLIYECEKPSSQIRSKRLWPLIKFGRLIEEYNNPEAPAIRDYKEDLKRVTSYFYFDHLGRYIQISKCLQKVLSWNLLDKKVERDLDKKINIEQHCFDQLAERKISPDSVVKALQQGHHVLQYCLDRRTQKLYKNKSYFHKDLRVIVSEFDDNYRVKTAYRTTEISDKNLLKKLKDNQKKLSRIYSNPHDYAVIDLDALYQSSIMLNKSFSRSKTELYQPAWDLIGNTFGCYQSLLSDNNENVRSNQVFEINQRIVDQSVLQSSIPKYRHKSFNQIDYDPKKEYGLIFFYEKKSFLNIAKRIYGLGLSAKIVYKETKVDPITKKEVMMVGCSLTSSTGHEWIKSSDRKELITINPKHVQQKK